MALSLRLDPALKARVVKLFLSDYRQILTKTEPLTKSPRSVLPS